MPKEKTDPRHMYPLRDAIRRRINELGITQSEAARRVDVEVRLLNSWLCAAAHKGCYVECRVM